MFSVKSALVIASSALAVGCNQGAKDSAGAASASAAALAVSAAPAASAKPAEKPWYAGEWHATLNVERYQIEQTKEEGKIKAWADAGDTKAIGKGELVLQIDDAGKVTGSVTGPLGDLEAAGMLDDKTLRVRFQPAKQLTPPEMYSGVLLAEKSEAGFAGDLKASSGDSQTVRKASVVLSKKADDAKGSNAKDN